MGFYVIGNCNSRDMNKFCPGNIMNESGIPMIGKGKIHGLRRSKGNKGWERQKVQEASTFMHSVFKQLTYVHRWMDGWINTHNPKVFPCQNWMFIFLLQVTSQPMVPLQQPHYICINGSI